MRQHPTFEYRPLICLFVVTVILQTGCAEGPLWRAGKYSPWARNQWAEEEKIADTMFKRRREMNESVAAVVNGPVAEQQRVAESLAEVLHRDPVLLLRLYSVNQLGKLNCPAAIEALKDASRDPNPDLRVAAIKAWQNLPAETAIPQLQEMIGSDTNDDVRLAATKALGNFQGEQAIAAIALALDDPNPALQLRAAESLQSVTGESIGRDVVAWQDYVKNVLPKSPAAGSSASLKSNLPSKSNFGTLSNPGTDSIFQ